MTICLSIARFRAIGFGAVILMSAGCSGGQAQSGAPITKAPAALRHQTVVREPYEPRAEARRNEPGLIRLDEHISKECFSPDPVATPQRLLSWKFDKDSEGWTRTDGSPLVSVDGRVRFTVDALNPGILSPVIDAPIRELITVEVMLSVSGGERIRFYWSGALPIPTDTTSGSSFWSSLTFWKTPSIPWTKQFSVADSIAPGNEIQRFALRSSPLSGRRWQHLNRIRIDPTDGAPADVVIDSIRIVGREDAYRDLGHGLSQEAFGGQIRNVIFNHAPSEIAWDLTIPPSARLDVGAGTFDADQPVTLSARIEMPGETPAVLFEDRIDDETSWHDWQPDISRWGGRAVRLVFSSRAERSGQVVLWSNPMILSQPVQAAPTPARAGIALPKSRPNVIVYVEDTLRSDHTSPYGHGNDTTPALNRLATQGAVFENCTAAACWTRPSLASIFTSLPAPSHGVTDYGLSLSYGAVTLAEQMRREGYLTAAFVTSNHAGALTNLQQGYDFLTESQTISLLLDDTREERTADYSRKTSTGVNRAVLPWIDRYGAKPFFIYLHTMDPHAPYLPDESYRRMFSTGYQGKITGEIDSPNSFEHAKTPEELAHVLSLYDGDIRDNDDRLGELVAQLEERGLLDNTLIVFTSDHGEEFFEHGKFQHGHALYRESLDVPLVMRLPGRIPPATRIHERVSSLDIMPTILALVGISPNPDIQGRSLLGLIEPQPGGSAAPAPDVFSWRNDRALGAEEVSLERDPFKLILTASGMAHLFDRSTDPTEQNDIAASRPDIAGEMERVAREWLASRKRIVAAGESTSVIVDPRDQEWLKALGYVK